MTLRRDRDDEVWIIECDGRAAEGVARGSGAAQGESRAGARGFGRIPCAAGATSAEEVSFGDAETFGQAVAHFRRRGWQSIRRLDRGAGEWRHQCETCQRLAREEADAAQQQRRLALRPSFTLRRQP